MSAMGQKETSRDPIAMSVKCQKEDILSSLLARCFSLFAIKNSLFRLQGIRPKKFRVSMGLCQRGGRFNGNSLYFPADQGISDSGDLFAAASQHSHTKYLL